MAYKIQRTEYDLTEEEQEQAKFLIEYVDKAQKEWRFAEKINSRLIDGAMDEFKFRFYSDVNFRLGLKRSQESPSTIMNREGTKVIHYEVVYAF